MTNVTAFDVIEANLSEAMKALFVSLGIELMAQPKPTSAANDDSLAAIIGFAAPSVRGSIVLVTHERTLDCWRRALGDTKADAADVLGELANLLAGRLKIRLVTCGLPIMISTPTSARGRDFILTAGRASSHWLAFDVVGGAVAVRLEAEFGAAFHFGDAPAEPPAQPGESVVF